MKECRPEHDNATGVAVRLWGCRCLVPLRPIGGAGPLRTPSCSLVPGFVLCSGTVSFSFFRIFLTFRFSRERIIVFLINTHSVLNKKKERKHQLTLGYSVY
jgi:hypothetical protein